MNLKSEKYFFINSTNFNSIILTEKKYYKKQKKDILKKKRLGIIYKTKKQ